MKFFKSVLMILISLAILSSCQQNEKNPAVYKEIITKENLVELSEKLDKTSELDALDLQYFSAAISRLGVIDSLAGKSVGEVIKLQKEFARNQAATALISTAPRIELILNHSFKYVGVAPKDDAGTPLNVIVYEVTNKSDKDMVDLQGGLQFVTPQGNKLVKVYPIKSQIAIEKNGAIKPGETRRLLLPFDHSNSSVRDSLVRNLNTLKHLWQPVEITFADGTKISVKKDEK